MYRFLLAILVLVSLGCPAPARAQLVGPARLTSTVDSLTWTAIGDGRAAGAVVVVQKGGEVLVRRGYGRADIENDVPMRPGQVFSIASVTKQFTAAAVLQLVEQGKVDLDEPIRTYLPEIPTQGRRITVRHLLTHTSGLPDITEMPAFRSVERLDLTPDSTISLVREEPLYFDPGEQMRYSNTGYLLLGMLIERLSGQRYEEYLAEHLFAPAGMGSSRYCDPRAVIPHRARGYEFTPEGLAVPRFVSLRIPFSAGGICSTAADLAAWNRALYGGRILQPRGLAEMVCPAALLDGRHTRYGMGVAVGELAGKPAYHHGGDIQGFTSYTAYFPGDSLSIVVLINTQGPARPDALVERIAEAVLGGGETQSTPPEPRDLASFSGEYGGGVAVAVRDGRLHLEGSPRGNADLRFVAGTTFTDGSSLFTFERQRDGRMTLWADLTWALVRWDRK